MDRYTLAMYRCNECGARKFVRDIGSRRKASTKEAN